MSIYGGFVFGMTRKKFWISPHRFKDCFENFQKYF